MSENSKVPRMSVQDRDKLIGEIPASLASDDNIVIVLSKEESESLIEYFREFTTWNEDRDMLMESCRDHNENVVRALIKIGIDVNHKSIFGWSALDIAKGIDGHFSMNHRSQKNESIIKLLIESGAKEREE